MNEITESSAIIGTVDTDIANLRNLYNNSSDFLVREININNIKIALVMIEGMFDLDGVGKVIVAPLLDHHFVKNTTPQDIYDFIYKKSVLAVDQANVLKYSDLFKFIMSGFVVVLIDGIPCGISMGMQGFNFRSIGQPVSENNVRASQEGFTEPLRINMTMVRRRIKSPNLCFKILSLGETSKTDICLMYMTDKVSINLLNNIEKKLKNIKIDLLLNSGYIIPFLEGKPYSIFSDVGTTERPDTLCAKINEGRIAIVIDGTPYAIIVPYLFTENFQTMDDYSHKAVYGSFIRILKYLAFFISILLPGIYVAISTFHPELLPHSLLFNIVAAEETTPFPLFVEALILHIMYEIMREAGLRLPKVVGHAVSIVGALVIGDAVVSAGLVGSPIVLIVALTAITSFVVPSLYQQIAILRLLFIIMGGTTGLFGIALLFMLTLINACSIGSMGMPYTSPIAPFSLKSMRDTFIRSGFNILNNKGVKLQDLEGSKIDDLKL